MNIFKTNSVNTSLKLFKRSLLVAITGLMATQSFAQYGTNDSRYDRRGPGDYVVVYEHCDFRGERREVPVGQHRSLKNLRIANDSISSIEVPRGMELTIFEDDNFRGDSARLNSDVACLDRNWNDRISSMDLQFRDRGRPDYDDRYDNRDYRSERPNPRDFDNRRGVTNPRNVNNRNVDARDLSFVSFSGTSLAKVGVSEWQSTDNRGRSTDFREVSRDAQAVYLENNYTSEKIKIDLFANQVTMVARDGRQYSYPITRKRGRAVAPNNDRVVTIPPASQGQNRTIRNRCFTYRAYTRGGEAGVRFQGKSDFKRFTNKRVSDRICHDGKLTMEISKRKPGTEVVVEIEGNRYVFAANDKGESFANDWYRKSIRLRVGRQ